MNLNIDSSVSNQMLVPGIAGKRDSKALAHLAEGDSQHNLMTQSELFKSYAE